MDEDLRRRLDRIDRRIFAICESTRTLQIQFADMAARLDILLEAHGIDLESDPETDFTSEGLREN